MEGCSSIYETSVVSLVCEDLCTRGHAILGWVSPGPLLHQVALRQGHNIPQRMLLCRGLKHRSQSRSRIVNSSAGRMIAESLREVLGAERLAVSKKVQDRLKGIRHIMIMVSCLVSAAVPEDVPHQAQAGQEGQAEPPHPPVDSLPDRQQDQVGAPLLAERQHWLCQWEPDNAPQRFLSKEILLCSSCYETHVSLVEGPCDGFYR